MKKRVPSLFIPILFLTGLCTPLVLFCPNMPPPPPPGSVGGLLPMPTAKEMEEIENFLATLSPEELDELAKIGEEIIKEAENQNIPLFGPPAGQQPPAPAAAPTPAVKPKPEPIKPVEAPKRKVDSNKSKEALYVIQSLIKNIDGIRRKISNDNELEDTFSRLDQPLNTFVYYLHVAQESRIVGFLNDKEFTTLYDTLKLMDVEIENFNRRLTLDDRLMGAHVLVQRNLEDAQKVVEGVMKLLEKSFGPGNIIAEFEKLFKKYEPEALKVKKELEAHQQKAHEAIKKIPVTNNAKPMVGQPIGRFGGDWHGQQRPYNQTPYNPVSSGSGNYNQWKGSGQMNGPSAMQPRAGMPKPGAKPGVPPQPEADKKAKPATPTPATTINDLEKAIQEQLGQIDGILSRGYAPVKNFFGSYKSDKTEPANIETVLGETNFALRALKKTIAKWSDTVDKNIQSYKEVHQRIKKVSDIFKSSRYTRLRELHDTAKELATRKVPLEGNVKQFKSLMDDIEKKLTS